MHRPAARHVLPEFTERTSQGVRTLDPYSKLLAERIVMLGTAVDDTAANDVIAQLLYLEYAQPDRHLSLYVNSPGGSLQAMTAIYDTIQLIRCDVETVCLGQAAGEAALLIAAGTPGMRMALPGARIILRQPALGEPVDGQPSDLEVQAAELLRLRAQLAGLLARHTGRTAERVADDLERDRFLTAGAALEYGLVDQVVSRRPGTAGAR
ncbi:ATP-dependent Clp protease proteolytic subunit [Streptomyces sp. NPDC057638]|uniref:ATP-dependent Clp protease proteolytic subunit n=1 Tax=Streptomyces sp. NPDC057638 TaxID=3346190 RepID=UPI00367F1E0D